MASFASLKQTIFDKEARKQQYQAHIRGLNAYDRHKKFVNDYVGFYGKGRSAQERLPIKTDQDTLREGYRFIRSEEDDMNPSWEQRLVKRYYDKLFKEYCIADMSQYKSGKIGLRWRTEKEVASGKGKHLFISDGSEPGLLAFKSKDSPECSTFQKRQFVCGNKHCNEKGGLASYELPPKKQKTCQGWAEGTVCQCPPVAQLQTGILKCAEKLLYKNRKEKPQPKEKDNAEHHMKRKRSESDDSDSEYTRRKDRRKGRKASTSTGNEKANDDENFDEYLEGMFP